MANPSNYESAVITHYNRRDVQKEIARFSKDRWVALHCELHDTSGRPYLLRYRRTAKRKVPLTISGDRRYPVSFKTF
jgi:hypothetical protein